MNERSELEFKNVCFSYDDERILTNFSFSVQKQTHVVLKGASGGGKSTILKLILGFLKPNKGEIRFYKNEEDQTANIRSYTSWLPQDLSIGVGTVADVLSYPFRFAINTTSKPDKQTYLNVLARLDLSESLYTKPFRDISTGQRQRIGIALCYLLDKPLILLDEPTASLDETSKRKVAELLMSDNKTIISTSHDPFWLDQANQVYEINEWI